MRALEPLETDFLKSKRRGDPTCIQLEKEFILYLERLVDDLDRKIKRGRERLDQTDDKTEPVTGASAERLKAVSDRIQLLLR